MDTDQTRIRTQPDAPARGLLSSSVFHPCPSVARLPLTEPASARQRLASAGDLVPVEELHELADVVGLLVLVIDVEGVFVDVADDQRLAQPDHPVLVRVAD